jgi:hypothetical protein
MDLEVDKVPNMNTRPEIIIISEKSDVRIPRPSWMKDGSFLVFRKLEQNVEAFENLTDQWDKTFWKKAGCISKEHMAAKLMGRWKSGKHRTLPS